MKVNEQAWKDEQYKYTVNENKIFKEKVKVNEMAWKDEQYTYTVNEFRTEKAEG